MTGMRSYMVGAAILCAFLLTVGCGKKDSGPRLIPVTGKVTLDGKAGSGVMVTFVPTGATPGEGGYGLTDSSGAYQLKGRGEKMGVPAGEYKIVCTKMVMPDGSDFDPSKGVMLADSDAKQVLPAVYSDQQQTTLKATVPEQGGNFDFELKSK